MRTLRNVVLLLGTLLAGQAGAVTVYYQPTPYPLYKSDGSAMPQSLEIVHAWDGWITSNGSNANKQIFRQPQLRVGGSNDFYRSYLNFDLVGLPAKVNQAALLLNTAPTTGNATTTPFAYCSVSKAWDLSLTWNTQQTFGTCYGWYPAPSLGNWVSLPLQSTNGQINWYNSWQNGSLTRAGVMVYSQYNNNRFDVFWNTLYNNYASDPGADGRRPIIQLDFTPPAGMPNYRMPLPGGYSWLLTNEAGGYECAGTGGKLWPDTTHQGNNYFALDFTNAGRNANGKPYPSSSIPILAAAQGTVVDAGGSPTDTRGYYVTLDNGSGYFTRYLHLQSHAATAKGVWLTNQTVQQGDQIGFMGNTGLTTGTSPTSGINLHINFWYGSKLGTALGSSATTNLTYIVMEGLLLKSYQTECSVNSSGIPKTWIRYYASSNTPTGK